MLKVYDNYMNSTGIKDKKIIHQQGIWHKVFSAILYNNKNKCIYFQTIYPKDSYSFDRDDFIDFAIGGHVEDNEDILATGIREAKEELGISISDKDLFFIGMRICNCDPSETYKIREFQHFYAIETNNQLKDMDFSNSDNEVKSIIEIKIDDYLKLLTKEVFEIKANEMILDKNTRKGTYIENITITDKRIVKDYFADKSILEKFLAVKMLMEY